PGKPFPGAVHLAVFFKKHRVVIFVFQAHTNPSKSFTPETFRYKNRMREVSSSSATDSAAAKGPLWVFSSCSWIRFPTSTTLLPTRTSAMKNSRMLGTKVSTTPESSPGTVSLKDAVKKARRGEAPRSRASSSRLKSSFSALEYTEKSIKGNRAYTMPTTTAG